MVANNPVANFRSLDEVSRSHKQVEFEITFGEFDMMPKPRCIYTFEIGLLIEDDINNMNKISAKTGNKETDNSKETHKETVW